jgi:hypothetical protein
LRSTDTPPLDQEDTPTPTPETPQILAEPQPSAIRGTLWIVLGCVSAAALGVLVYAAILLAKRKKNV